MAIADNSYGSLVEVGANVTRYANKSVTFDAETNPTGPRVEKFIDRVSAVVNSYLSALGFTIPITQADAKLLMDNIVVDQVTLMVEGVNGTGRYAPGSKTIAQRSMMSVLTEEVTDFLDMVAIGLEDLGAERGKSTISRISFRDSDERGNETFPMFQRAGFGNKLTDWDSD